MLPFRDEVRGQYRTWIILTWITSILTGVALCMLVRLFYVWVFQPMRILIDGSRRVAGGDFGHRIQLQYGRRSGRTGRSHERHDEPLPADS